MHTGSTAGLGYASGSLKGYQYWLSNLTSLSVCLLSLSPLHFLLVFRGLSSRQELFLEQNYLHFFVPQTPFFLRKLKCARCCAAQVSSGCCCLWHQGSSSPHAVTEHFLTLCTGTAICFIIFHLNHLFPLLLQIMLFFQRLHFSGSATHV